MGAAGRACTAGLSADNMEHIDNTIRFHFLYIDSYCFNQGWIYPEQVQPYNMLRYIQAGEAVFKIDGKKITATPDTVIYVPRGSRLECSSLTDSVRFTSLRFTTSVFFWGGDFLKDYYGLPSVMKNTEAKIFFEKMEQRAKKAGSARMFWIRGYLDLLIACLIEKHARHRLSDSEDAEIKKRIRTSLHQHADERIQTVTDYLILHLPAHPSVSELAAMAHLSESRFRSLFTHTGKTPLEYIKELKINLAAQRLLTSDKQIGEIAWSLGFEDTNYFIRVFKQIFGLTPNQYRKQAQE